MQKAKDATGQWNMCDKLMVDKPNKDVHMGYDMLYCDKHKQNLPDQVKCAVTCGYFESTNVCYMNA